ncbi:MAG: hypothetical protein MK116_12180 [Phycisphaerales bacterium]|nr:hypothetical protein [Phycisphaerales bacterium]
MMNRDRSFLVTSGLVCSLFVLSLCGCASRWVTTGGPDSPTEGLSIDLLLEGTAQKVVRYQLNGKGQLWFSGGRSVSEGEPSWEGRVNSEKGRAVADAVAKGKWFVDPPTGDGSESQTWTVKAWDSGGRHASFMVYGRAESVDEIYAILNEVSKARFDGFLRELPKPSLDRQLQRDNAVQPAGTTGENREEADGGGS